MFATRFVIAASGLALMLCSCRSAREGTPLAAATETATIFGQGVISDENEQWRITFTPDGKTAFFAESEGFFPVTRKATIWVSSNEGGKWSEPKVAAFSGTYADIDPFISPDGRRLYFSSIRPVNGVVRGDVDIWYVDRTGDGWSAPVRPGDEVNSPDDELYPSASSDGTLYFASGPLVPGAGKHFDIFRAPTSSRGFESRQGLGPAVNTMPAPSDPTPQSAWEFNPEISADGNTLVFTSLRPGYGLGDLYVSHFRDGKWSPAQNLGPAVNTAADEFHPTISRNRRELYFVRRVPRKGDFYVLSTRAIPLLRR